MAVNILPILKQKPVAEALIMVGNNSGIKTDNEPWLMPKKKPSIPISTNVSDETAVLSLNTTTVIMKQTAKHSIMVLRSPIALAIQPDITLPLKPETAEHHCDATEILCLCIIACNTLYPCRRP